MTSLMPPNRTRRRSAPTRCMRCFAALDTAERASRSGAVNHRVFARAAVLVVLRIALAAVAAALGAAEIAAEVTS